MATVNFKNVGASKMAWQVKLKEVTSTTLEQSIRQRGALQSRYLDFDDQGNIWAGLRVVGTFEVIQ